MRYFGPQDKLLRKLDRISPVLASRLDYMRLLYGAPIKVTGSWRATGEDGRISEHQENIDGEWEGVDIACRSSRERFGLLRAAFQANFERIGIYDKHLHLGVATARRFPQEVSWLGKSR